MLLPFAYMGCESPVEDISSDNDLRLHYSSDTVTFDTLFSSVGSITKRLKIYNTNDKAIKLDQLSLGRLDASPYSITVNGEKRQSFQDEVIFGKDSLLVLVEVLIDPANEDLPFLVKDSVVVQYNSKAENIKLVAWGQDAIFINNEAIPCGTTWTKDRPYVIYKAALVDSLCTLIVEEGTRIYIDNGASIFVKGSLQIQGSFQNKVIIRNTRLDPKYEIAHGQWDGIYFLEGSFNSSIDHAEIRNGNIGVRVGNPDLDDDYELIISNTSIGHMSRAGIEAYSSDIQVYNTEVFDCQNNLVVCVAGGTYDFEHCTFSNSPNEFIREGVSVGFSNSVELEDGSFLSENLTVKLSNSIIWGKEEEEFGIDVSGNSASNILVENNIIRSEQELWTDLGNTISQEDNFPGFYSPNSFNYQIDSLSNARDKATLSTITHDLLGTLRDALPDLGAYERKDSIP